MVMGSSSELPSAQRSTPWRVLLSATALLSFPALAQQVDLTGSLIERVQTESAAPTLSVSQSLGEPLATAGPVPALGAGSGTLATARQTMLWARQQRLGVAVGLGVEERNAYRGQTAWGGASQLTRTRDAGLLVGVAVDTGERSQLTLQTPLFNASPQPGMLGTAGFDDALTGQDSRQMRMGLVFNTKKPYSDLRRGVRFELSGQTTLSFRPRGGRVGLTLQTKY
jgi:hypothetical protein